MIVRPGDRIPVDGRVLRRLSSVDQSPITGESLPAEKHLGDEVFAGTINPYGAMELAVERLGHDTTLEQIIHLIEHAEETRPRRAAGRPLRRLFRPHGAGGGGVTFWLSPAICRARGGPGRRLPLRVGAGHARRPSPPASGFLVRRGILVKGGAVLENLGRIRSVVFDKTGTLTLARLASSGSKRLPRPDRGGRAAAGGRRGTTFRASHRPADRRTGAADRGSIFRRPTSFLAHPGLGATATVDRQCRAGGQFAGHGVGRGADSG